MTWLTVEKSPHLPLITQLSSPTFRSINSLLDITVDAMKDVSIYYRCISVGRSREEWVDVTDSYFASAAKWGPREKKHQDRQGDFFLTNYSARHKVCVCVCVLEVWLTHLMLNLFSLRLHFDHSQLISLKHHLLLHLGNVTLAKSGHVWPQTTLNIWKRGFQYQSSSYIYIYTLNNLNNYGYVYTAIWKTEKQVFCCVTKVPGDQLIKAHWLDEQK